MQSHILYPAKMITFLKIAHWKCSSGLLSQMLLFILKYRAFQYVWHNLRFKNHTTEFSSSTHTTNHFFHFSTPNSSLSLLTLFSLYYTLKVDTLYWVVFPALFPCACIVSLFSVSKFIHTLWFKYIRQQLWLFSKPNIYVNWFMLHHQERRGKKWKLIFE